MNLGWKIWNSFWVNDWKESRHWVSDKEWSLRVVIRHCELKRDKIVVADIWHEWKSLQKKKWVLLKAFLETEGAIEHGECDSLYSRRLHVSALSST